MKRFIIFVIALSLVPLFLGPVNISADTATKATEVKKQTAPPKSVAAPHKTMKKELSNRPSKVIQPSTTVQGTMHGGASDGVDRFITGTTIPRRIGKRLTINGQGFGDARGIVRILSQSGIRYNCDIHLWRNTRVDITLPGRLQSHADKRNEKWTLWVLPAGKGTGPTMEVTLIGWEPVIHSLSTTELTRGDQLVIEGDYFLDHNAEGGSSWYGLIQYYPSGYGYYSWGAKRLVSWSYNRVVIEITSAPDERKRYRVRLATAAGAGVDSEDYVWLLPE